MVHGKGEREREAKNSDRWQPSLPAPRPHWAPARFSTSNCSRATPETRVDRRLSDSDLETEQNFHKLPRKKEEEKLFPPLESSDRKQRPPSAHPRSLSSPRLSFLFNSTTATRPPATTSPSSPLWPRARTPSPTRPPPAGSPTLKLCSAPRSRAPARASLLPAGPALLPVLPLLLPPPPPRPPLPRSSTPTLTPTTTTSSTSSAK